MINPVVSSRPRLLVLAPNWLGDVVMTTPLLSMLAGACQVSGHDLVLGVRPAWAELFRADGRLSGLFLVERTGRHAGLRGLVRLAQDLRRESFVGVVLGPPSLRMGLVARLAGIPLRVGYSSDGRGFLLSHSLSLPQRGDLHYSQEMIALGAEMLRALGQVDVHWPERGQTLPIPALPGCRVDLAPVEKQGPPIWALGPGATFGAAKSWPLPRLVELVHMISERGPARIVLLGDAQVGAFAQDLASALSMPTRQDLAGPAGLVDLTGRTDLLRVTSILTAAKAFVGNDSGLMHLAGALGVPTVGVFGSSNPEWTAPLGYRTGLVAVEGFACHPCYRKTCNQPRFCLETVTAEAVLQELDSLSGTDFGKGD